MAKWKIDTAHATAEFKVKHLGISWVRGQIYGITGDIEFEEDNLEDSKFNGEIDVNTITTGQEQRDGHLKSADFFDVENFPTINFESKGVLGANDNQAKVKGDLTIHGVTKEVELEVTYHGEQIKPNMDGSTDTVIAFTLETKVDRRDFDLNWNVDIPGGKVMIGNEVEIVVELEAIKL